MHIVALYCGWYVFHGFLVVTHKSLTCAGRKAQNIDEGNKKLYFAIEDY